MEAGLFLSQSRMYRVFPESGMPGIIVLDTRCSFPYLMVTIVAP